MTIYRLKSDITTNLVITSMIYAGVNLSLPNTNSLDWKLSLCALVIVALVTTLTRVKVIIRFSNSIPVLDFFVSLIACSLSVVMTIAEYVLLPLLMYLVYNKFSPEITRMTNLSSAFFINIACLWITSKVSIVLNKSDLVL